MSLPTYDTFAEKNGLFAMEQIDDFEVLMPRLHKLKSDGYYFRGQSDAGWKLYSGIQRDWILNDLDGTFSTAEDFNTQHLRYQQQKAVDLLDTYTKQRNDLADSSALQHYGAPTPFLDFTSEIDASLFFATDGIQPAEERETSQRFSIYAWKPGDGPATASNNDMTNWETVVDHSGEIDGAVSLDVLQNVSMLYIKQGSGKFLQITNERVDLQNGLFVYSPKAVREGLPYEELFTGMTIDQVENTYDGLFIPKLICLEAEKTVADEVVKYLAEKGVNQKSLGLSSDHWARPVYNAFIATHTT